jgi:hypothetical protein
VGRPCIWRLGSAYILCLRVSGDALH